MSIKYIKDGFIVSFYSLFFFTMAALLSLMFNTMFYAIAISDGININVPSFIISTIFGVISLFFSTGIKCDTKTNIFNFYKKHENKNTENNLVQ